MANSPSRFVDPHEDHPSRPDSRFHMIHLINSSSLKVDVKRLIVRKRIPARFRGGESFHSGQISLTTLTTWFASSGVKPCGKTFNSRSSAIRFLYTRMAPHCIGLANQGEPLRSPGKGKRDGERRLVTSPAKDNLWFHKRRIANALSTILLAFRNDAQNNTVA